MISNWSEGAWPLARLLRSDSASRAARNAPVDRHYWRAHCQGPPRSSSRGEFGASVDAPPAERAASREAALCRCAAGHCEAVGDCGGFASVRHVELAQDVGDMDACGLDADDELVGDVGVGVAAGDEREDVDFARSEAEELRPARRRLVGRCGSGGARSSRARWASSSSSRRSGSAPIRVATVCASRSGMLAGGAGCAGGDERLGLAPAAIGRQRRAFEVLPRVGRVGPRVGRAGPWARSYSASARASQPPALGVIDDAVAAALRAIATSRSALASQARRRRRHGGPGRGRRARPGHAGPWR